MRWMIATSRLVVCWILWCLSQSAWADPLSDARLRMVELHVATAGITNERVLESMRTTPRHEFLTAAQRSLAYFDMAIPIGEGQTISPPYVVAFMTEQLDPQPTDRVLEIGTGSGYQAAVLSPLVRDVYTIEIQRPLGERAAAVLQRLKYTNVHTRIGDGYAGWPEAAPFQKIIVTCSPEKIPQPLVDQLDDGGQIIVPVGERFQQTLCRFRKVDGKLERETLQATFFVPMTGKSEDLRETRGDDARPHLVHGSFEEVEAKDSLPVGWYYIREGRVVDDARAPHGKRIMQFENDVPGRGAHALQAFGIDGRVVHRIVVKASVRGESIHSGDDPQQRARIMLEFYSENRAPVGRATIGPWTGSFDWREQARHIPIPIKARLGVLGIGMFGATGSLAVDNVSIDAEETPAKNQE